MPAKNEKIGELVRRGVLLFSQAVPFPASALVAAIGAAAVSKILEIHEKRVSEILSSELTLDHISYVEPTRPALMDFYVNNPLYPELAKEFSDEISKQDERRLRSLYPFLYGALVLKREIPNLLFHREIQQKQFRKMAENYEQLSRGFHGLEGDAALYDKINHFGGELLEVLNEVYEETKKEITTEKRKFAFDVIDYIREVLTI